MEVITYATVLAKHNLTPKERCFATHSGISTETKKYFSVNFSESIKVIFEYQTNLKLLDGNFDNFFHPINSDTEKLNIITNWIQQQSNLIFLRDCLDISLALDKNFCKDTQQKTEIGELEYQAKYHQKHEAILQLASIAAQKIKFLPFYQDADYICAVPPQPNKTLDLPSTIADLVSASINKPNITKGFVFNGKKLSVKEASFEQKWNIWEQAQPSFNSSMANIKNKNIILIDDKYQSGITMQYIAMKLQQAGASKVYGLCLVKTMGNSGNIKNECF